MLAAELALARVDVAIVERRESQELAGLRAGGLHSRSIEVLDQRGVAERFLSQGKVMQAAGFALIQLDLSDFPVRHNYVLALTQNHIERVLADWVEELKYDLSRARADELCPGRHRRRRRAVRRRVAARPVFGRLRRRS